MKRSKQRPRNGRWAKFVNKYVNRVVRHGYKVALRHNVTLEL